MTVQELADYLHVNIKTVYRLLERGKIPATRVGHLWRFDKSSIDVWLKTYSTSAVANILVIDDDESVCTLFKEALAENNYQVTAVQNPFQGLELVKTNEYDMVFLDLFLPEIDGANLFRSIKTVKPDLPVTIITGYPDSDLMMNALTCGPFGVMKKPFTPSDIFKAVNNHLRSAVQPK